MSARLRFPPFDVRIARALGGLPGIEAAVSGFDAELLGEYIGKFSPGGSGLACAERAVTARVCGSVKGFSYL